MKHKLTLIFIAFSVAFVTEAYEVNTHQAITHCALARSDKCGQEPATNLLYFAEALEIVDSDYKKEKYEHYKGRPSYYDYLNIESDFKKKKLDVIDQAVDYKGLIEIGSILEDSLYHNGKFPGEGRYNNHFYSAQFALPYIFNLSANPFVKANHNSLNNPSVRLSNRALHADRLFNAIGTRTDSISWALNKTVNLGSDRVNYYNLHWAFKYYRRLFEDPDKGFVTQAERKANEANLFVTLGFLVHLLQDIHSPAHVRNGPHATGDFLEIYNRHDGGFLLKGGELSDKNSPEIMGAIKNNHMQQSYLNYQYYSYEDFFKGSAFWTSSNFFSEAHSFFAGAIVERYFQEPSFETGDGGSPHYDTCNLFSSRNTTIFDERNPLLNENETGLEPIPHSDSWLYITNNSLTPGLNSVAMRKPGIFANCDSMSAHIEGPRVNKYHYTTYEKGALRQTSMNTIPRAIVFTKAFINFFFRGRMEAQLSKDKDTIVIKNVSDPRIIQKPELLTFKPKADAFSVYYISDNGNSVLLDRFDLSEELIVGGKVVLGDIKELLISNGYVPELIDNNNLVVLFDGKIGDDEGQDEFTNDNRGMSVAYVTSPLVKRTNQTIALKLFDDGHYKKGAFINYTRDNDTVVDHFTDLMWQDNSDARLIKKTWVTQSNWDSGGDVTDTSGDTAVTYCQNLNLGGYTNWRLPTVKELLSIVDYDTILSSEGAAIDKNYFQNAVASNYWSITPYNHYKIDDRARFVSFEMGHSRFSDKILSANVRCVRHTN